MPQFATSSSRWAALQSRDPLAASAFIYSVTTTKIYCRPNCSSRLARRANIVFHNSPAEAEADGFRPCKRCRPEVTENDGDSQKLAVAKACELLRKNGEMGVKLQVKALAAKVGLTECHFCRVFKKVMGITVGEYRRQLEGQRRNGPSDTSTPFELSSDSNSTLDAPADDLITPEGFDMSATFNPITQAELDNLDVLCHTIDYSGWMNLDACRSELPELDPLGAFAPPCPGVPDEFFDLIDFDNQPTT
ncbi:uncharacterized protein PAC_10135 [Phialocephala subalpina]|uniref:HTH araC/xylS-type domain-containing protein n=1 Tax=Phialocephala subalpina TaxID=576137 RepID=A0A1L7X5E1_9HELO|nr:uncharacterized protein PAC_10135 [Phialocephala subalpina]